MLGLLLLRPGRLVPASTLVADLWGEAPPSRAENSIQVHVSRLRRALPSELLVTRAPGYLIDVEPEQVDAVRFERAALEARERFEAGDVATAAAAAADALGEWRGSILPGTEYFGEAAGEVARLEELHLRTAELDGDARLALGRHAELVAELEALVKTHPLHEPFRRQLMLALYRSGRQADALDAYTRARDELIEHAGIDPSPDLQDLQRMILLQDASLSAPAVPGPHGAAPPQAATVRKTVSAVYAAVHGGDAPTDPELHVADLDALGAALERHGGTTVGAPDGVVALFGVPQVREDDAMRAARGALACVEAVPAASIGIASGDALVEAGGGPHGPVVRDAARLAHAAAPGAVLLSDATDAFLRDAAVTEPYSDRRGSLSAARLVEIVPGAQAIARRHDLPLVGRTEEFVRLEAAFERVVRKRTGSLLTLLGQAGIGKSRLAQELRSRLDGRAATLSGHCPADEAAPLQALYEIVRDAAGEVSVPALTALLVGERDATELAEAVCEALGAGESDEPPELFWAFRRLFETLGRREPTVVFVEDLQWADATLLDLVERLVDGIRDAPLLFVCLARPELLEQRPAWGGGESGRASLLLEPLTDEEALELIEQRGGGELDQETRARIAERAEGNPLYIEQVLALLAEAGPEGEPSIPPSIHALIEARLDALEPEERLLLQHGAVAGREFDRAEVGLLLGSDPVDELVESLTRKELLDEGGNGVLRFRHGTIRDVAYSTLPKRDRARLHEALAEWLEREDDGTGVPPDETIAYHLEQAIALRRELGATEEELHRLGDRARRRLATAGRRAQARSEARRAIDLLSRAAATAEGDAELLIDLAEVLRLGGELEEATARIEEARSLAAAAGDETLERKAEVGRLQMQIFTDLDLTSAEVVPVVERAIAAFERSGDDAGLARAWYLLGWVAWLSCRADETVKALELSIRHAEIAGSERARAQGLHLLAGAYLYGPVTAVRAIERCEAVMAQYRDQRRIVASTARALAGLYAMTGEFGRARELIAIDRATAEDFGLRVAAAAAAELYGWVYLLEGRLEEAEAEYRRGLDGFHEMGDRWSASTLGAGLAQVLHAQGRFDEALVTAEESRDNAAPDDLHTQIQWRGPYAKALAHQGKLEAAQRIAQEAIVLARTTDFVNVQATALADLGETLRLAGDTERAAQVTRRAIALYEKKGNSAGAAALRAGLDLPD